MPPISMPAVNISLQNGTNLTVYVRNTGISLDEASTWTVTENPVITMALMKKMVFGR